MRIMRVVLVALAVMMVAGCAQEREEMPQLDAASIGVTPEAAAVVEETAAPVVAPSEPEEPAGVPTTYTVQRGDTLYSLAKRFYGDGKLWTKIADANKDKVHNVNAIPVGTVLTVPPK